MWQEARNVSSFFRGVANLGKHQTHYLDTVSLQVPATPRPTYSWSLYRKKNLVHAVCTCTLAIFMNNFCSIHIRSSGYYRHTMTSILV